MATKNINANIQLNDNQILGALLQKFDNLTISNLLNEAGIGYHTIKKVPVFHDGVDVKYLVTQDYVTDLLGGFSWKDEVRVASGSNIDTDTLLVDLVVDGETLVENDRILLFGQTDATENGVWVIGADISSIARSYDMDASSEFTNAVVPVSSGTTYEGWIFRCKTVNPTIGTTEIEFTDMNPVIPVATETVAGKIRIATLAAVQAGVEANTAVTPSTLDSVLSVIRTQLEALLPSAPDNLAGKDLIMTLYAALAESTGTSHSCTDEVQPIGSVADFYNGDSGVLTAVIDTVADGAQTLSTLSDVGVYDSLHITADEDPYGEGELGHGLYKQLSAYIQAAVSLSVGQHTYKMTHSETGDTSELSFYVDDPGVVTISDMSVTLPALSRYISGVPSLDTGDALQITFNVNNAVNAHYNATRVARIQGVQTQSVDYEPPVTPPVTGAIIGFSDEEILILTSAYSEDVEVSIYGYNSKGTAGTAGELATSSRVDTMSNETRKEAGSGQYPSTGYGGIYDSTQSLKTYYTEELQLLNGRYQVPAGDYTGNLPTAGPDYSTGMGTGDRWVLFDLGITLDNASSLVITLPSPTGTWSGVETEGLQVQIKVEGVTGWLDANSAFSLVGAPESDGDACMVYSDSSTNIKKASFGSTPRSGVLMVRIGLPYDSDKKIGQEVTVTDIN